MLKTKKSKQNVTILVLSVMLAIAAIFGVTAAWFISNASASGTVGTGAVKVTLLKGTTDITGNTGAFTVTNAVAGTNVLGDAVSVKVEATGTKVYLRATINVDVTGATGETQLTAADFELKLGTGWTKVDDFYYYGTGAEKAALTEAETGTIALATALKINDKSNAQSNTGVTVTIKVEAVQSANQGDTIAWNND